MRYSLCLKMAHYAKARSFSLPYDACFFRHAPLLEEGKSKHWAKGHTGEMQCAGERRVSSSNIDRDDRKCWRTSGV